MRHILITGANRGIGLGFVRDYLAQGRHVWACCRNPERAEALHALRDSRLHLLRWDVSRDDGLDDEAALPERIDLLINNAGIYGPGKDGQSLERVSSETMWQVFNIDALGPLRVVQRLRSRLDHGAVIANISSKMGSVADNSSGGTYAYRAAKSALIMISRSMGVDLAGDGIHVITLHPGWVRTDMTAHNGLIDVATSVAGMREVIEHARDYEPGAFIAYDGKLIPY